MKQVRHKHYLLLVAAAAAVAAVVFYLHWPRMKDLQVRFALQLLGCTTVPVRCLLLTSDTADRGPNLYGNLASQLTASTALWLMNVRKKKLLGSRSEIYLHGFAVKSSTNALQRQELIMSELRKSIHQQ